MASTLPIQKDGTPRAFAIPPHGATPGLIIASYDWNSVDDALRAGREPDVDAPFAGYSLTLIVEADDHHSYRPAHVLFHRGESESAMSYYRFISAVDLDGDGLD